MGAGFRVVEVALTARPGVAIQFARNALRQTAPPIVPTLPALTEVIEAEDAVTLPAIATYKQNIYERS